MSSALGGSTGGGAETGAVVAVGATGVGDTSGTAQTWQMENMVGKMR